MIMLATAEQVSFFGFHIPYLEHLGVEPISCENDQAVVRMPIQPHLINSHGHVHGGGIDERTGLYIISRRPRARPFECGYGHH